MNVLKNFSPRLSIVLTVYNSAPFLFDCLRSIEQQTFQNYELIIINDGSSDNSESICLRFCQNNPNWRLYSQDNCGVSQSRNFGLSLSRGEWIIFLDSDDIFHPRLFEFMMNPISHENVDIVVCKSKGFIHNIKKSYPLCHTMYFPDNLNLNHNSTNPFLCFAGWAWDKMFRVSFLRKHHLSFPKLNNSEDLVFTYSALSFSTSTKCVEKELIYHRIRKNGSISSSHDSHSEDFYKAICLMRQQLVSNPKIWADNQRYFDNWALHFALWYAFTLKDHRLTMAIINNLRNKLYTAINLNTLNWQYFNWYPLDVLMLKVPNSLLFISWKVLSVVDYIMKYGPYNTLLKIYRILGF